MSDHDQRHSRDTATPRKPRSQSGETHAAPVGHAARGSALRRPQQAAALQHSVYLGLGSNLGDRAANLAAALCGLAAAGVAISRCSPLYETEPVGLRDQPWFLNLVAAGETGLSPTALLGAAKTVERAVGRAPGRRWGPRVVDVDILLYDDWQVAQTDPWLVVPHPEMWRRRFVLVPLHDLRPDLRAPDGAPLAAWIDALETADPAIVRPWPGPFAWRAPDRGTGASTAYP